MGIDDIMRPERLTDEELAADRARLVSEYAAQGYETKSFTCDTCDARHVCLLAFDLYNLDGDCLAEK